MKSQVHSVLLQLYVYLTRSILSRAFPHTSTDTHKTMMHTTPYFVHRIQRTDGSAFVLPCPPSQYIFLSSASSASAQVNAKIRHLPNALHCPSPPNKFRFSKQSPCFQNNRTISRPTSIVMSQSLIPTTSKFTIWAILLAAATAGLNANSTKIGRILSGPIVSMWITAFLVNTNILPPPGPHYSTLNLLCVQLATPLLLFDADLRDIAKKTGKLGAIFLIFSLVTVIGAVVGIFAMKLVGALMGTVWIGEEWKMCAAIVSKNIGGGFNFVAVANTFSMSSDAVSAGLAIDNLGGMVYFPLLSYIPIWFGLEGDVANQSTDSTTDDEPKDQEKKQFSVEFAAMSLTISAALMSLSNLFAPSAPIPALTGISVLLATVFSKQAKKMAFSAEEIGKLLLFIYFATAGACAGSLFSAIISFFPVVAFTAFIYMAHFVFIYLMHRVFKLSLKDLLICSNANIGGPATASAFAVAKGWTSLIIPGILVGNLGQAIATFIGLGFAPLVRFFL